MRIKEFAHTYCKDLIEMYKTGKSLIESYDLPYDGIIEDEEGNQIQVVYAGDTAIPIIDIISFAREDFAKVYSSFECRELYDKYMEAVELLEGEEAIMHIRNTVRREQERIKAFSDDNDLSEMV